MFAPLSNNSLKPRLYHLLLRLVGKYRYEQIMFRFKLGYPLDAKLPRTFNEKVAWRKLWAHLPQAPMLADKFEVRNFVANSIGDRYLNRLIVCSDTVHELDFSALPKSFVAKATHGSGMTEVVRDRDAADIPTLSSNLNRYISTTYGTLTNEWWYSLIKPRIIIEDLLYDHDFGIPVDYKFYVFNGRAKFVQVDTDRFTRHKRNFYDIEWRRQRFSLLYPPGDRLAKPTLLGEMQEVAEQLAKDLDFARVDLYCLNNNRVVFGEITLAPDAGWGRFRPRQADRYLGSYWQIESHRRATISLL